MSFISRSIFRIDLNYPDIFPRKVHKWPVNTWEDVQHLLIIREIQIKTIMWCYFTPIRMTDIRNELLSCSYLFLLSVRLCIYLEVNPMVINFLRNHHIVFNSGCTVFIFPLAQHQDSISPHPPTLVTVCLAALFTIAKG